MSPEIWWWEHNDTTPPGATGALGPAHCIWCLIPAYRAGWEQWCTPGPNLILVGLWGGSTEFLGPNPRMWRGEAGDGISGPHDPILAQVSTDLWPNPSKQGTGLGPQDPLLVHGVGKGQCQASGLDPAHRRALHHSSGPWGPIVEYHWSRIICKHLTWDGKPFNVFKVLALTEILFLWQLHYINSFFHSNFNITAFYTSISLTDTSSAYI